jgi:hypothetical protein
MSTADKLNYLNETKEAIKTALVEKGVSVSDTDTFRSYADKIGEISSGGSGGASSKYGLSLDNILGDVNENGVLQKAPNFSLTLHSFKDVSDYALYYKFAYNSSITEVNVLDLETLSGANSCAYMFYKCENLTSATLSKFESATKTMSAYYMFGNCGKLTSVNLNSFKKIGYQSCQNMFYYCTALEFIDLSSLEEINGNNACSGMFSYCSSLLSVDLRNLKIVKGTSALSSMFDGCKKLPSISFPSLTTIDTNAFGSSTFRNCTALTEIHFRADVQSQIEATSGYSSKWGATNATIYFDL